MVKSIKRKYDKNQLDNFKKTANKKKKLRGKKMTKRTRRQNRNKAINVASVLNLMGLSGAEEITVPLKKFKNQSNETR